MSDAVTIPSNVTAQNQPGLSLSQGEHGGGLKAMGVGQNGVEILDESERKFKAWGTVEVVDRQGEIVKVDSLRKILPIMEQRGNGGAPLIYGHSNNVVGKVYKHTIADYTLPDGRKVPGVMIEGQLFKHYRLDDTAWEEIKSGAIKGVSLGAEHYGTKKRVCDGNMDCANVLENLEGTEWSLVRQPANPLAYIFDVTKGMVSDKVMKHFKEAGLDGRCGPCNKMVTELQVSYGLNSIQAEGVTKAVLEYLSPSKEKEGIKKAETMEPEDIKKMVAETVAAEMKAWKDKDEEEKKKKSVANPPASETAGVAKEIVWPQGGDPKVLKEFVSDITKGVSEEVKKMVSEEIKKALDAKLEGSTVSQSDPVKSEKVTKGGVETPSFAQTGDLYSAEEGKKLWADPFNYQK